jgi:tRNA (guanine37-N1)-methyltransferase
VTLRIDVISLFPALFPGPLRESISGRALATGLASLHVHDLREWGLGRHRSVDDYPYGGGAGMVMRPEPIAAAVQSVRGADSTVILLDPAGELFRQPRARELADRAHLVLVCPRYEGVDDRVRAIVDLELSIGDYVLSGGDLAAMVVIDAVLRLLPGAIDPASILEESFADGLLEYPQYTRPPVFEGMSAPEILLSGDHGAVARWRREQALERTRQRRPDLLVAADAERTTRPATDDLARTVERMERRLRELEDQRVRELMAAYDGLVARFGADLLSERDQLLSRGAALMLVQAAAERRVL